MSEQKNKILNNELCVFAFAMVCCLLWGSAFPCIKIGYQLFDIGGDDVFTQILFAGIRFFMAGVMAVAIGSVSAGHFLLPKKESWLTVAKLSFFQTIMQYLFFYIGLANTTGVKASIIEASNVFVAILVSALIFRQEKLTGRKMLGCVAGFAGVLLINLGQGGFSMTFRLNGEGFVFLSTVAYAFSSALLKRYSQKENTVMLSGYQFAFGGMVMIAVGLLGGGAIKTVTTNGIAILIYLAFISAAAYSLWGLLLKYNPVSKISVYGFMNPVFGVLLSALLLTEQNGNLGIVKVIISLALVGAGILIVNLGSVPQKIYHSNFKY